MPTMLALQLKLVSLEDVPFCRPYDSCLFWLVTLMLALAMLGRIILKKITLLKMQVYHTGTEMNGCAAITC